MPGAPDLLTVSQKMPLLTVSQQSSPHLPASDTPPPRDLERGSTPSPPVSPIVLRAGSPNISRPPSPTISRANSIVPEVIIKPLSGKKRIPDEVDKEPKCHKEKRPHKGLGGDDVDAEKKRGPEEVDKDNEPPYRKEKRHHKEPGGNDTDSGDTSLKGRNKQSQLK